MSVTGGRLLMALVATVLALSGCALPVPDTGGAAFAGLGDPQDVPPPEPVWAMPDCEVHRVLLAQDSGQAREGLPPGRDVPGPLADLLLIVATYAALDEGNLSVRAPFSWALVAHRLRAEPARPDDRDLAVREVFLPDATLAAQLSSAGLPARAGQVTTQATSTGLILRVEAGDVRYEVTAPQDPSRDADDRSERGLWLGGDGGLVVVETRRLAVDSLDRAGALGASGGYLGAMFPEGAAVRVSGLEQAWILRFPGTVTA